MRAEKRKRKVQVFNNNTVLQKEKQIRETIITSIQNNMESVRKETLTQNN